MGDQVLGPLDKEMARMVEGYLEHHGVNVVLNDGAEAFEQTPDGALEVHTKSGATHPADIVVLGIGVRPDTVLAKQAGLEIGERGGIRTDEQMRTGVEAEATKRGLKLNIRLEVDAGHQLIRQIERGVGMAVLARSAVMPELKDGKLVALAIVDPVFRRKVCLAIRRDKSGSFLLHRVQSILLSVVTELIEKKAWPGTLL